MRVLKPGGLLLSMVPDWESQYKKFYDDLYEVTQEGIIANSSKNLENEMTQFLKSVGERIVYYEKNHDHCWCLVTIY